MKNENYDYELNEKDIIKIKNKNMYYEITYIGGMIRGKRIGNKNEFFACMNNIEEKSERIEAIYNTEDEKNIIRERVKKEENEKNIDKLKELNIDINKFKDMTRMEKYKTINKKNISDKEKLNLINCDYDEIQKEIKTTMPIAVENWINGSKGLVRCAKNMIKMNIQFEKSISVIKHCCFCREIEGEMIQGNKFYAHESCLEKARKG